MNKMLAKGAAMAHAGRALRSARRGKATLAAAEMHEGEAPELKPFDEIPGPRALPIIGTAYTFRKYMSPGGGIRNTDAMRDLRAKYGDIHKAHLGPRNMVTIHDLHEYEKVLAADAASPDGPVGALQDQWMIDHYNKRNNVTTRNPFSAAGEEWRRGRMAANPHIFSPKAAKSYMDDINASSRTAVAQIEDFQSDLTKFAQYSSVDMFCAVALGIQLNATGGSKEGREFADVQIRALNTMTALMRAPWASQDWLKPFSSSWKDFETSWGKARKASTELIQSTAKNPDAHGFIQAFIGSDMASDEEGLAAATEMCMIFLLAAGDTTSAVILNTIYALGTNPRAQQALREELQRELKGGDLIAGLRLPYLESTQLETNRMYSAISIDGVKMKTQADLELYGYHVPKGTAVMYCGNRKASEHIARGDEFLPERWFADNEDIGPPSRKNGPGSQLDHPLGRQPFGAGPRQCIGSRVAKLEIRSMIARIVQDYKFTIDPADAAKTSMVAHTTQSPWPYPPVKFTKL